METFCALLVFIVGLDSIARAKNATTDRGVIVTTGQWVYGQSSLLLVNGRSERDYPKITFQDKMIDSCDVDVGRKMIYMFDMRHRSIIVGSNFRGSFKKEEMKFTSERSVIAHQKVQIAVDWVSNNIYWTDSVLGAIMVQPGGQDIPRSLYRVIVQEYLQEPRGLAVDPSEGFLFWVDVSEIQYKYQIERSSLTGKSRKLLFATNLNKLNALAVDVVAKRIYFSKDDYIESADYNGGDRRHILMSTKFLVQFFDVASYEDKIYATNEVGNVYRGLSPFPNIRGRSLCVFDRRKQQGIGPDPCDSAGCEDICVNEQGVGTCLCRNGFDLHENGKTCIEAAGDYHRAIILNNGTHLCLLPMDILWDNKTNALYCFYQHDVDSEQISYVDVNMDNREIFFATQSNIYRVAVNRTHNAKPERVTREFPDEQMDGTITGLSYNWVTKQLCWSQTEPDGIFIIDQERNIINVARNNGTTHPREVVFVQYGIKDHKLSWVPLHLFWISNLGNESVIETAAMHRDNDTIYAQMLSEKLHNISRLQNDINHKQLVVLSQDELSYKVSYLDYAGEEEKSFDISLSQPVSSFAQYKDLFLSVGVDKTNDTILYSHDSSAKPDDRPLDITFRVQEGIGSVLSLKMIDMEVLQPPFPDPCAAMHLNSTGCSQICVPQGGHSKCFCDIGYSLMDDGTTCLSTPVRDNFILVTDFTHGKLYQIPLNNSREIHGVHAMDVGKLKSILYNEITKTVVLVEDLSPQVWAISLDASWEYQVANLGFYRGKPYKLVLDPTTGYIYFIGVRAPLANRRDQYSYIIGVISPDRDSTVIYHGHSSQVVDLAIYPSKGLLFWTDDSPRLWRANMDGTDANSIASGSRRYYGLTIDYLNDRLYWSEYGKPTIYRSTLDGTDIQEFYSSSTTNVKNVKVFGEFIYYSGFTSVHINRVNINNISDVSTFGPDAGIGAIESFDVYSSNDSFQMPKHKACMDGNGGCSHFCLPRADGERTCACKNGFTLQSDHKTCNGTMCPAEIPNGQLSDSCFPKASAICDNFTCDQGYDRNKVVKSLICNESGLWNYDLSMLCIAIDKTADKRVLIIGVVAGGSVLVVIISAVIILYALIRKGKILANFRWSKTSDISSDIHSNLDDSGVAETSVNYIDHLSWLRTRINQFLILDDDADKALAGPDDRHR